MKTNFYSLKVVQRPTARLRLVVDYPTQPAEQWWYWVPTALRNEIVDRAVSTCMYGGAALSEEAILTGKVMQQYGAVPMEGSTEYDYQPGRIEWTYFFMPGRESSEFIKVGKTNQYTRRMLTLARGAGPFWQVVRYPSQLLPEAVVLRFFGSDRVQRTEWLYMSKDLIALVDFLMATVKPWIDIGRPWGTTLFGPRPPIVVESRSFDSCACGVDVPDQ